MRRLCIGKLLQCCSIWQFTFSNQVISVAVVISEHLKRGLWPHFAWHENQCCWWIDCLSTCMLVTSQGKYVLCIRRLSPFSSNHSHYISHANLGKDCCRNTRKRHVRTGWYFFRLPSLVSLLHIQHGQSTESSLQQRLCER